MEENQVFQKLKEFVLSQRLRYNHELNRETDLQKDLKIWGDDADEFIEAFSRQFNVDVSEFEMEKYFKSEGDWIFQRILDFFRKLKPADRVPLTLGDLEGAIKDGKLSRKT